MIAALSRPAIFASALLVLAASAGLAAAEAPSDGKGRFSMSPVDGGFLRLDTQTGEVSLCTQKDDAWACEPVKDTGNALETLKEENQALKEHIKSLEEGMASNEGGNGSAGAGNSYPTEPPAGSVTRLPTEAEIDQAFNYVERMYKKLRDRIERFNKDQPKTEGESDDKGAKAL